MRKNLALLTLVAAALAACVHTSPQADTKAGETSPQIVVDAAKLAPTREAACASLAALETRDREAGAKMAGMLAGDLEGFLGAVREQKVTVTFRDSNPACLPHLAAGVQSKPHDILQKTWDASNLKPEDQRYSGLVSDLFKKPPKGELVDAPKLTLRNGEPVTGDYDMMDQIEDDGSRVPGESPRDLGIRAALNASVPTTPKGHQNRVMHGAQTAYQDYLKLHADEKVIMVLYKPEAPLTALGSDGRMWHLETVEDALNFYTCRGTPLGPYWNVAAKQADGSVAPLR